MQPVNYLSLSPLEVELHSDSTLVSAAASTPMHGTVPLAAVYPVPASCLSIGHTPRQSNPTLQSNPLLLPLPFRSTPNTTNPIVPLAPVAAKPGCFLLQMMWTAPTDSSQPKGQIRQEQVEVEDRRGEDESSASTSTLSPVSCLGEKDEEVKEEWKNSVGMGVVSLNEGESTDGEEGQGTGGGDGGSDGEEEGAEGEGDQEREGEEADGQRENGGGEGEEDGEKEKNEEHDRQGEEEEEEDFDDLTQDEDEEEVMSSASEESVLSVPELQVNGKRGRAVGTGPARL